MYKAIRYIGSKQKVLPFLEEKLFSHLAQNQSNNLSFFDGFVGSGVVSQYIAEKYPNAKISGADISLYSEALFSILNLGVHFTDENKVLSIFDKFWSSASTQIAGVFFEEFSPLGKPSGFSEARNFFHPDTAQTIDAFKAFLNEELSTGVLNKNQAQTLSFFLLAYACKAANTTSVFGAFLKSPPKKFDFNRAFILKILADLKLIEKRKTVSVFYPGGIVQALSSLPPQTLIYLDPPYSTRRYESNYHILNFVADLNFNAAQLKPQSKTAQPLYMPENLFAQKKQTEKIFSDMLQAAVEKAAIVGISYNTDGVIQQHWVEAFCTQHNYHLETHKLGYKRFKSKKEATNTTDLEEILWLVRK